ncbi:hypothetical protein KJ766_02915 [Patescibacteria group bacterium]|nr:hypothetical protein [Patescibacteria group bacterium]
MRISFGKSFDDYLYIFQKAAKTTWNHKRLWILGLFAAAINTGSVFQGVFDIFWDLKPADKLGLQLIERGTTKMPWIVDYLEMIMQMEAWRATLLITIVVLVCASITVLAITSQYLLIVAIHKDAKRKKMPNIKKLIKEIKHGHLWSMFAVNAIAIILQIIIICSASFPLHILLGDSLLSNILVYSAMYIILIPLLFSINMIAMLGLINIVRKNSHVVDSAIHSIKILKDHWIISIEIALSLFIANIAAGLIALFITVVIIMPFGLLGAVLLGIGWSSSVIFFTILAGIIGLVVTAIYTSAMTTFNYSVWMQLSERLEKISIIPAIESIFKAGIQLLKK